MITITSVNPEGAACSVRWSIGHNFPDDLCVSQVESIRADGQELAYLLAHFPCLISYPRLSKVIIMGADAQMVCANMPQLLREQRPSRVQEELIRRKMTDRVVNV